MMSSYGPEDEISNNCVNGRLVSSASRFQSSGYASLCAPNADKSLFLIMIFEETLCQQSPCSMG